MPVLEPGDTIDIWVVEAALGSGGMGSVYRCHNRTATRILAAIKVLEGGLKRYPEAEARFIREAEILFRLDHPNIVKVRNIRTDADPPYLEMEFVAGESLDARMRRGPLTYLETLDAMRQVADALTYLHARQIRHRDIKPANVLVQEDGRLKLVDFGLAVEADTTRITQQGMAFGTVSYAPPEWITPDQLDPTKWDIYALGVVFYELLTGQLAFPISGQGTARQQAMQVIVAKQDHPPLDPGDRFHDDVRSLIADMTCSDPSRRIGEAREVVERMARLAPTPRRTAGVTLLPSDGGFEPEGPESRSLSTITPTTDQGFGSRATTPVSVPVRLGRMALAFGGVGAVALSGLLGTGVALAVALGWWWLRPPPARDLVVELSGLPEELAADLSAGWVAPIRDGGRYTFVGLAPGPVSVRWAIGEGCTVAACEGSAGCSPWCSTGSGEIALPAGSEPLVQPLVLSPPPPRDIRLALTGLPAGIHPSRARLGPIQGAPEEGGIRFLAVPPGSHRLELTVGSCPEEAAGCGAQCPAGCRSVSLPVAVPLAGDPSPASLEILPPERVEAPAPPPAPRRSGVVTIKQLAGWIGAHPEWAPGGRFAGDERYLSWWATADRSSSAPATQFTPKLADAFCRDQGARIPPLDAEPRVPPEGRLELRLAEGKLVLLESLADGSARWVPHGASETVPSIVVFRCAKQGEPTARRSTEGQ